VSVATWVVFAALAAAGFLAVELVRRPRRSRGFGPFFLVPTGSTPLMDDPLIDWRGSAWVGIQLQSTLLIRLRVDADRIMVGGLSIGGTWVAERPDVGGIVVAKGWQHPNVDVLDHDGARSAVTFIAARRTVEEVVAAFVAAGWPCSAAPERGRAGA
jgi:hypothetical protein